MIIFSSFSRFTALASGTTTVVEIPSDYGYVVLTGIASACLLTWQSIQVGQMRKKFGIHYPTMYSQETSGNGQLFNCYQRAHQNTLESYPVFLMLLFTGGLQYPIPSALGGAVWIAGKVAYSQGYYTGDPKNRMRGSFGYLGLFVLLGSSSLFGAKLLGWY
ncbi:microsomal glutathione S-transferase 3 isoform X1 [Daphnia magna]|uniref:microsomal glutathione S-transferase 3 isoform X1 n=1 Tax=Daphnia magna TaxID=35525 RepID=UPI0006E95B52|nr:microsomal glutathione S-transferase 3 isoform X1 [Daphnia magna]